MAGIVNTNVHALRERLMEQLGLKNVEIAVLREEGDSQHGRSRGYHGFLSEEEEREADDKRKRSRRYAKVSRKNTPGGA
jgi:hypothetical protein